MNGHRVAKRHRPREPATPEPPHSPTKTRLGPSLKHGFKHKHKKRHKPRRKNKVIQFSVVPQALTSACVPLDRVSASQKALLLNDSRCRTIQHSVLTWIRKDVIHTRAAKVIASGRCILKNTDSAVPAVNHTLLRSLLASTPPKSTPIEIWQTAQQLAQISSIEDIRELIRHEPLIEHWLSSLVLALFFDTQHPQEEYVRTGNIPTKLKPLPHDVDRHRVSLARGFKLRGYSILKEENGRRFHTSSGATGHP